jgi:hypothetical protein
LGMAVEYSVFNGNRGIVTGTACLTQPQT